MQRRQFGFRITVPKDSGGYQSVRVAANPIGASADGSASGWSLHARATAAGSGSSSASARTSSRTMSADATAVRVDPLSIRIVADLDEPVGRREAHASNASDTSLTDRSPSCPIQIRQFGPSPLRTPGCYQEHGAGVRGVRPVQPHHQPADAGLAALHAAGLRPRADHRSGGDAGDADAHGDGRAGGDVRRSMPCAPRIIVPRRLLAERAAGPGLSRCAVRGRLRGDASGAESLRDIAQVQGFIATQGLDAFSTRPGCRSSSP